MIHRLQADCKGRVCLKKSLGIILGTSRIIVGSSKLDKWHGQSGQIGIKNITEGICGKWIAERMTFKP